MRKIETEMNNAVRNKIAWSKNNTLTTFSSDLKECFIYLHGNHIATYNYDLKELSCIIDFQPSTGVCKAWAHSCAINIS